ncbi:hypothetical protein N7462_003049 [Penicillium macrosclerotiorum]|uniref:uncharacterized protein n=1 Tax=Penicillium macrosclerotiorum TaxID=303699 RepID=UPI002548C1C8|nr:uncharacterized protein N7462_003049 [Penicillium macrosclerotiorum]KAJ5688657.1 hypothetical protein N7462_003049 [Penicillium macrosclerotiorum]
MYSTFTVATGAPVGGDHGRKADQPKSKRPHVLIACEHCRKNRIKCDNGHPCRNCKHRNISCTSGDYADTRALSRQVQHLLSRVKSLEEQVGDVNSALAEAKHNQSLSTRSSPISLPALANDLQPAQNLSSTAFAAQLQLRLGVDFLLVLCMEPHGPPTSTDPGSLQEKLPRTLTDYYIRRYWRTVQRLQPVLDEPDNITVRPAYLTDLMLAISLRLDAMSKPRDHPEQPEQSWILAQQHYERSVQMLAQEPPTLGHLQACLLMVIYQRQDHHRGAASEALTQARNIGNQLGLCGLSRPKIGSDREIHLATRLQAILLSLEAQQLLESGCPSEIAESPAHWLQSPPWDLIPVDGGEGTFLSAYASLLRIAKATHLSFVQPTISATLCQLDQGLPDLLELLDHWRQTAPARFQLRRKNNIPSMSTDSCALDLDADQTTVILRQCLILELTYHWIHTGLLRSFFLGSGEECHSTSATTNATKHALAITRIISQALEETEVVHGWSDAHFIQWDGAMTLMASIAIEGRDGVAMGEKREALAISKDVLDMLGTRFTTCAAKIIDDFLSLTAKEGNASLGRNKGGNRDGKGIEGIETLPPEPLMDYRPTLDKELEPPWPEIPSNLEMGFDLEGIDLSNWTTQE